MSSLRSRIRKNKLVFIGLDLSLTGSGVVLLNTAGSILHSTRLSVPQRGAERLYFLKLLLQDILDQQTQEINIACIEAAAYRESGKLYELGQWAGIVMVELFSRSIPIIEARPLQLKKFISGVGKNQGKSIVILDVFKYYGVEIRNDDIADAFVLANIAKTYYEKYILNKDIPLKKYQEDVLKKIYSSYGKVEGRLL